MENKNVIIILVAVIIVLAAILGVMLLQPTASKEPTKLVITSNDTLMEGDGMSFQLTDLNKTALPNEKLNVKIADSKGKPVINKTVKTNSYGKAKLDLDLKKGEYGVCVTFRGDDNYTQSNATQKLTVEESKAELVSASSANSYPKYNSAFGSYRTVESQQELALIETSGGQYYVLAGDGYYTYGGHDSKGYIKLGNFVGKY